MYLLEFGLAALKQMRKGNPGLDNGCRFTKVSMHRKMFSLPLRKIFHHTGIFTGRFPSPTAGFFHHVMIFPVLFPSRLYIPGRHPSLLMEGIQAYLWKKMLWVSVKIFL
jgi:hypothetical protein